MKFIRTLQFNRNLFCILFCVIFPFCSFAETLNFDTLEGITGKSTSSSTMTQGQKTSDGKQLTAPQIFKKNDPAVVTIVLKAKETYVGHGSGFLIKSNGYVLTNDHVISVKEFGKYASLISIEVITADGRSHKAQVIKGDPDIDLALIKIKGENFPVAEIGNAASINAGETLYIIGTPVRLEYTHSITPGMVSGFDRHNGKIQTSALIHGGNSGGPAINDQGKVVGVAVAVATSVESKTIQIGGKIEDIKINAYKPGISFLIPINYANNLLNLMF